MEPSRGSDGRHAGAGRVEYLSGRLADGDRAVWGRLEGYRLPAVGHGQGIGCRLGLGRGRGGGEEEGGKARVLKGHEVCLRSEEHTSELQSLMRISYAGFCLQKKIII